MAMASGRLTGIGDFRITSLGGEAEYVLESRTGKRSWAREVGFDRLDEAIERTARMYVEARFRRAHSEIALDYEHVRDHAPKGTRLIFSRGAWRLERNGYLGSKTHGKWPTIYQALISPRRKGAKHREIPALRRVLFVCHVSAVRELRADLPDPDLNLPCFLAPEEAEDGLAHETP